MNRNRQGKGLKTLAREQWLREQAIAKAAAEREVEALKAEFLKTLVAK